MKRVIRLDGRLGVRPPPTSVSSMVGATSREAGAMDRHRHRRSPQDARRAPVRASAAPRDIRRRCRRGRSRAGAHLRPVVGGALAQPRRVAARRLDGEHDQRGGADQRLVGQVDLDDLDAELARRSRSPRRARRRRRARGRRRRSWSARRSSAPWRAPRRLARSRPARRRWSGRAGPGPAMATMISPQSSAVRASGPTVSSVNESGIALARLTRP